MTQNTFFKPLLTKIASALFLFVVMADQPSLVFAQSSSDPSSILIQGTNPLQLLQQRLSQGSMAASGIPLEGAVDPDEYVVGPGDSFSISISGQEVTATPAMVGVDGRILLPDAGGVAVAGLTLTEARSKMMDLLTKSFKTAQKEIALVQSRQFYVHVAGAVPRPGRYLALPVARVSSVLEFAFADTTAAAVSNLSFVPSLRNIELMHRDGSTSFVDMVDYYSSGNRRANPYLKDGDVIHIPAIDPSVSSITVGGYVPFPGRYDFKKGDRLVDIIRIAGGIPDNASLVDVSVLRKVGAKIDRHAFTRVEAMGEKGASFEIQALDVISVSQTDDVTGLVQIQGRVRYPGSYPISAGKTTLKEVLAAAGGMRDDALLRGVYIERNTLSDPMNLLTSERFSDQKEFLKRILASDTTAIRQQLRLTDMGFLSRAYFSLEANLQNRVSIGPADLTDEGSSKVILEPNDIIVIPRDTRSVFIIGQVNQPGFVPYQEGMSTEYYLAAAGGRSSTAGRTVLLNPANGHFQDKLSEIPFSGDVIFVDRDKPLADSAELQRIVIEELKAKDNARFLTAQVVIQSIGTLASVVALIISLSR